MKWGKVSEQRKRIKSSRMKSGCRLIIISTKTNQIWFLFLTSNKSAIKNAIQMVIFFLSDNSTHPNNYTLIIGNQTENGVFIKLYFISTWITRVYFLHQWNSYFFNLFRNINKINYLLLFQHEKLFGNMMKFSKFFGFQ